MFTKLAKMDIIWQYKYSIIQEEAGRTLAQTEVGMEIYTPKVYMSKDDQDYLDRLQQALELLDKAFVLSPNQEEDGLLEQTIAVVRNLKIAASNPHGPIRQGYLGNARKLLT